MLTSKSIIAVILITIAVILLCTFPRWREEVRPESGSMLEIRPFPSRKSMFLTFNFMFVATLFLIVSILWQVTASNAVQVISSNNGFLGQSSRTAQILIGVNIAITGISAFIVMVYLLTLKSLDTLVDNDESSDQSFSLGDTQEEADSQTESRPGSQAESHTTNLSPISTPRQSTSLVSRRSVHLQ